MGQRIGMSSNYTQSGNEDVVSGLSSAEAEAANCSNTYCVSDEEYLDMIRDYVRPDTFEWCIIALYVVVFVVGVFGNGLVVYVVWFDRRMRTVTNLFIVNLSLADFFVVVVCLPPTVLGDVTETWFMGNAMCKIVIYVQGVSVSVSVMTLTAISVERYYAICHPLKFKATLRRARVMIAVIWLMSIIILLPDVIVLQTFPKFPPELQTDLLTSCKPAWDYPYQVAYQLFLIIAVYFVPLVLMAAAYTSIAICLWSTVIPSETVSISHEVPMSCRCANDTATSGGDPRYNRVGDVHGQMISRRNVAKMLIAVVAMFGVCYLPVHLLNILRYAQVNIEDDLSTKFALVAHWLCYFNSSINPVIYNFMSEKFQKAFRDALSCRPCTGSRQRGTEGANSYIWQANSVAIGGLEESPAPRLGSSPDARLTPASTWQKQQQLLLHQQRQEQQQNLRPNGPPQYLV